MFNILIMDPDNYVKHGLSVHLKYYGVNIMATASLSDMAVSLNNHSFNIAIMELFSRDDDVMSCIEFVRLFKTRWPEVTLIIHTQITNEDAVKLLIAVTGVKNIFYKNDHINVLTSCISQSFMKVQEHNMPHPYVTS